MKSWFEEFFDFDDGPSPEAQEGGDAGVDTFPKARGKLSREQRTDFLEEPIPDGVQGTVFILKRMLEELRKIKHTLDRGYHKRSWQQSIGTTSEKILGPNPSRKAITLTNNGTNPVFVGFNQEVAISGLKTGQILGTASAADKGDGGTLTINNYVGEVWGIAKTGANNIIILEEVE